MSQLTVDILTGRDGQAAPEFTKGAIISGVVTATTLNQNMTLNDTTTGEDLDCNLVIAESQMVIDAGIGLTVGDGKKVLTDLYDIY